VARARRVLGIVAILLTAVVTVAIVASGYWISAPGLDVSLQAPPPAPAIRFGVDTFAFANENRTIYRGKPDLYPNWCFVMARAVTQFQRFARFDPAAPRLAADEYTARVRRITARAPWRAARVLARRGARGQGRAHGAAVELDPLDELACGVPHAPGATGGGGA
jgi:hypothetical protein